MPPSYSFAKSIVDSVAAYGPSSAVVEQKFFKAISAFIDSLELVEVKQVNISENLNFINFQEGRGLKSVKKV